MCLVPYVPIYLYILITLFPTRTKTKRSRQRQTSARLMRCNVQKELVSMVFLMALLRTSDASFHDRPFAHEVCDVKEKHSTG